MNTQKTFGLAIFLSTLLLCVVFFSSAKAIDYISYVGAEVDNGARWLTVTDSTMDKSLLTTGTVYGNVLAVNWDRTQSGALGGGISLHSSAGVDITNGRLIDNPLSTDDPIGTILSGFVTSGSVNNGYTLTFTQDYIDNYGTSARIGIMYDVLRDAYVPDGSSQQEEISIQIMSNTASRASAWSAIENREPDIYFFDVVGIKANESISLLFTDRNFTNTQHQGYLGALSVDPIPVRGADSGTWKLNFTDSTAANYLDTTKVMPSRALANTDGAMTSAVARLDGTSAGNHDALSLTGLSTRGVYRLSYTENGEYKSLAFPTNNKGERSIGFGGTSSVALDADFLANVTSVEVNDITNSPTWTVAVDFQGMDSIGHRANGITYAPATGEIWNAYEFRAWQGTLGATTLVATKGYQMSNLLDTEGNTTDVYFSTVGSDPDNPQTIIGWAGHADRSNDPAHTDNLYDDYLFGNNQASLGTTNPLQWEIGGLEPGDLYQLVAHGGWQRVADITVFDEIDGNELQQAPVQGEAYYFVYADEFGRIMGAFGNDGASSEQNWSGFQLISYSDTTSLSSATPEPATWLLMVIAGAIGGVCVWRKKRNCNP